MDFFERQRRVRGQSRRLVILFVLAVVAIVLAVDIAFIVAMSISATDEVAGQGGPLRYALQNPGLLVGVSLVTVAVIAVSSLGRIASLRGGGGAVARQLGGVPVGGDTTDPQLRRLRNVVEEIAIAASVPVPEIYVLEEEEAINAFAAGYGPSDAAVAVTRGALQRLNRDELQGVIAHEFSHILNGDMRLNIRLMGVLFGILVLGIIGRRVLIHGRGGRSKDAGAILVVALALTIIGWVGLMFGRMIKAGISRQREYLADASAVQFTRQTSGIAGALKKIAGLPSGAKLANADTEEVSHMLFGDGIGYSSLFATHPPLPERIKALDPQFDERELETLAQRWAATPPNGLAEDRMLGFASADGAPMDAGERSLPVSGAALRAHVGELDSDDIRHGAVLAAGIPDALHVAALTPDGAMAVVLGLLLDHRPGVRATQVRAIRAGLGAEIAAAAEGQGAAASGLHAALRLPLVSIAFPALRRHPRTQLDALVACVEALIHADGEVGLFEYCIGRLLQRQVLDALDPSHTMSDGRRRLAHTFDALADVLAVLALHGHVDQAAARRAFAAGVEHAQPGAARAWSPPGDWAAVLDRALPQLDALEPRGKSLVLEALVETVAHDGRVSVAESELLRTIAGYLHLPLPPLLDTTAAA